MMVAACKEAGPWSTGLPAGWERMQRPSEPHAGADAVPTSLLSLSASPPGGPQERGAAVQGESQGLLKIPRRHRMSLMSFSKCRVSTARW